MTPGERIRTARQQRGLSQNKLAATLGTTDTMVRRWERGRGMHTATLVRLCRALEVSADWLLGLED